MWLEENNTWSGTSSNNYNTNRFKLQIIHDWSQACGLFGSSEPASSSGPRLASSMDEKKAQHVALSVTDDRRQATDDRRQATVDVIHLPNVHAIVQITLSNKVAPRDYAKCIDSVKVAFITFLLRILAMLCSVNRHISHYASQAKQVYWLTSLPTK